MTSVASRQLHDRVVEEVELSDRQKSIICERIGVSAVQSMLTSFLLLLPQLVDKRLTDGADEYLQLMDLCSVIMTQLCQVET